MNIRPISLSTQNQNTRHNQPNKIKSQPAFKGYIMLDKVDGEKIALSTKMIYGLQSAIESITKYIIKDVQKDDPRTVINLASTKLHHKELLSNFSTTVDIWANGEFRPEGYAEKVEHTNFTLIKVPINEVFKALGKAEASDDSMVELSQNKDRYNIPLPDFIAKYLKSTNTVRPSDASDVPQKEFEKYAEQVFKKNPDALSVDFYDGTYGGRSKPKFSITREDYLAEQSHKSKKTNK